MVRAVASTSSALLFVFAVACAQPAGPGPSAPEGQAMASITVTSKSFASGAEIPVDYTCDGKEVSPQVTWSAPPAGTKALAVVLDDPDAPGGTFTHWIVLNLPAETVSLAEAVDPTTLGAKIGQNDFHSVMYRGPCPPRGDGMHRYQFRVFALDAPLKLEEGATRAQTDEAMSAHVLGYGVLSCGFGH
jgi:Raf kinase inhibitor-like YbhB/YbcL family protein